jgi:predicted RNA-binding protein associated with RNAse of E/G family
MENLPIEIVKYIISYDKRFIIRNGEILKINQIDKNDKRYNMLLRIKPKNYDINDNSSYVYLTINSYKDYCIRYCDYILELIIFCYDEKGNMDIDEIQEIQ